MNGRLFVDLSTSLSASIITEWLSVKDRVRLDSAHCQASVREEFLFLSRSPELSVKSWVPDQAHWMNQALVTWALLREVYVEQLSVKTESNLVLYNAYLQKFASRVLLLRWNCSRSNRLAQSVTTCCNLLVLKIYNWKLSASLREVFVCCKRLREFCGHSCTSRSNSTDPDPSDPPLTSVHFDKIVCNNLKYLELKNRDVDLVAAFLRMAVAVEVVALTTAGVPLNGIPESVRPTTNTLSLNGMTLDAGLANFATRSELLENLCFPLCNVTDTAIRALCEFSNLRALDLTTAATFESENYFNVLASSCGDRLTELLLYGCRPTLSLDQLQQELPRFTQLTSFSFVLKDHNPPVWDMSQFSGLTKLLVYCTCANNGALVTQLTKHCHVNIRELSLLMFASDFSGNKLDILVSTCTKLRILNLENIYPIQRLCTEEEKERWQDLRPGLVVGDDFDYRLNVFKKYKCSGAL